MNRFVIILGRFFCWLGWHEWTWRFERGSTICLSSPPPSQAVCSQSMKCKKIRKLIYGDMASGLSSRKYIVVNPARSIRLNNGMFVHPCGTLANNPDSLRAKYQSAKKERYAI